MVWWVLWKQLTSHPTEKSIGWDENTECFASFIVFYVLKGYGVTVNKSNCKYPNKSFEFDK